MEKNSVKEILLPVSIHGGVLWGLKLCSFYRTVKPTYERLTIWEDSDQFGKHQIMITSQEEADAS